MKNKKIYVTAILTLFNFVFLGTEYLFDNMMMNLVDSDGVVLVQNYILGASVLGFVLFPFINRYLKGYLEYVAGIAASIIAAVSVAVISGHSSYEIMIIIGCIFFVLLGITGSAAIYYSSVILRGSSQISTYVGIAYAAGVFLQFINNNIIKKEIAQKAVIIVLAVSLIWLIIYRKKFVEEKDNVDKYDSADGYLIKNKILTGMLLVIMVALMSCIFVSLDNAVTLVHAQGSVDIGQLPRILLALSGLCAGFLFDIHNGRYMSMIMYCITLISTLCIVIINFGGIFIAGLVIFYISAGFFAVFFTASFMSLSYKMKNPEFWAGLGRAVNNLCAVITSAVSVKLLTSGSNMVITVVSVILFVLISIVIFIYLNQYYPQKQVESDEQTDEIQEEIISPEKKFELFCECYSLTEREKEVLNALLSSDKDVQDIAESLFISRAALYRHISSINQKTNTNKRVGLIQYYYVWNPVENG